MESKEQVFRHSFGKLALMSLGVVFLVFFASFLREEKYFFVLIVIFVVSLYVFLLYITSRVKISDEKIVTRDLLGSKSLKWLEIDRVSMRRQALRLHNHDEDIILSIDSQLEGYIEILDVIFKKRPDLFDISESNVFSRSMGTNILVIGFGLAVIFLSTPFFMMQDQDINWLFALIFLGLGLYIIVSWFLSPQGMILENQTLFVKYLFKETSYKVSDINSITLERKRTRDGYIYFTQINPKTGRPVKLSGFKPGSALTYQILKRWHAKSVSKQSPDLVSTITF